MTRFHSGALSLIAACVLVGCGRQESGTPMADDQKVPGMSEFDYLSCDGGPHLVLPEELSRNWKGVGSILSVLSPKSDYGRACAATEGNQIALISVGKGQAIVLANPPLSAWGRSSEGWIDIYCLEAWADTNTDALIKRAVAGTPTQGMTDNGKVITLTKPGMILLYAGDEPGSRTVYGEYKIPINPGSYGILEGHYKPTQKEEVYIYRLRPKAGITN